MNSIKSISPSSNKNESPKTPGGISKSLLTPCRRVGLSRKWKKGGCSPFVSPLSTQNFTLEKEDREGRKRKVSEEIEILQEKNTMAQGQISTESNVNITLPSHNSNNNITTTPIRPHLPRKKSKTLSLSRRNSQEGKIEEKSSENKLSEINKEDLFKEQILSQKDCKLMDKIDDTELIPKIENSIKSMSQPIRTKSKSKNKLSLKKSNSKGDYKDKLKEPQFENSQNLKLKVKSPNNLTKECIVVIQNTLINVENNVEENKETLTLRTSQESLSEPDIPLSMLNKKNTEMSVLNDDDFICKPAQVKKKFKNLSIRKPNRNKLDVELPTQASQSSQESLDKKTILIKKSYDKVTKPLRAKSTGSITQEDVDELMERIETKKKLLMAKATSTDTEELRILIKKWQKGCQDALMELLDLMKRKLPEHQNMDHDEMLQKLKIPKELVGYDSENDCFVTPDDTNVLLAAFKL